MRADDPDASTADWLAELDPDLAAEIAQDLAAEASLSGPPEGAHRRVLAGVMGTLALPLPDPGLTLPHPPMDPGLAASVGGSGAAASTVAGSGALGSAGTAAVGAASGSATGLSALAGAASSAGLAAGGVASGLKILGLTAALGLMATGVWRAQMPHSLPAPTGSVATTPSVAQHATRASAARTRAASQQQATALDDRPPTVAADVEALSEAAEQTASLPKLHGTTLDAAPEPAAPALPPATPSPSTTSARAYTESGAPGARLSNHLGTLPAEGAPAPAPPAHSNRPVEAQATATRRAAARAPSRAAEQAPESAASPDAPTEPAEQRAQTAEHATAAIGFGATTPRRTATSSATETVDRPAAGLQGEDRPTTTRIAPSRAPAPAFDHRLEAEHRLLESARSALQRGDAQGAQVALVAHREAFGAGTAAPGQLQEEAGYLAVRAAWIEADPEALTAAADRFLARWPHSLYAPAVRRLRPSTP